MIELAAIVARYLGITGMVAVGIIVFYEGLPLGPIRYIPWVGPALAGLVDGRVDREREAALEGYVKQAELTAAEAELAQVKRQLDASRKATEGFQELLAHAQAAEREIIERDRIEDEQFAERLRAAGRSRLLDVDDLNWLRKH